MLEDWVPRVLDADEIAEDSGRGIIENWLPPEDGEKESKELIPCAYCYGYIVDNAGAVWKSAGEMYGIKYGYRVWTGTPSPQLQAETPWKEAE